MTRHWIAKLAVSMLVATFAMIAVPGRASADSTCSSLLPGKYNYLTTYGDYYDLEVTVTKDSLQYVTYRFHPWQ